MIDLKTLHDLFAPYSESAAKHPRGFELRGKSFNCAEGPQLMGVVNLSSDSWYRESVCLNTEQAIERGHRLAVEGAALVDVGAESTILNAARAGEQVQTGMLLPVVRGLVQKGVLVSVETYHPSVCLACLQAGAAVLNMTAAANTEELYRMVADHDAGVIICYIQGGANAREVENLELSGDHTAALLDYFKRETDKAAACGVKRIWIDPGMGFYYKNMTDSSARVRYQIQTFLNTFRLRELGWPVCHALPHAFEFFGEEVRTAEAFFAVMALLGRADMLRTHEVAKVRGVVMSMGVL